MIGFALGGLIVLGWCWLAAIEREEETRLSGLRAFCGMPETEIADLVEALGKDVLEEAAHELVAFHATGAPTRRLTMLVSDGDGVIIEGDEASIGDGDAKHVAGEVIEHGLRALAPTGDVNDPGCGPGRIVGGDQIGTFACQQGTELAAHQISEEAYPADSG